MINETDLDIEPEYSLHDLLKQAWNAINPNVGLEEWHIKAICEHLEAVNNSRRRK
jgi:hypothetical protein